MRVINSLQGTAAVVVSADEVAPPNGIVVANLLDLVASTYKFASRPAPPNETIQLGGSQFAFQSGVLEAGNEKFPIVQLAILTNADVVTSVTTEIADKVLDDYMERLDKDLGFRFSSATKRRIYQSNLVVEFDNGIAEKIAALEKIENLLSREIKRELPFKIKRLAFGSGNIAPAFVPLSIATIENSDFFLDRRQDQDYSKNRYLCGAPVSTAEHIRIMSLFEKELAA
jgi:hypothetical protein